MNQQFKNKTKTIFQEMYSENKWVKASVLTMGGLPLIYFLGQVAHILASSVRGSGIWGMLRTKTSFTKKSDSKRKAVY